MCRSLESVGLLQVMWGESVTFAICRSLLWVSFRIYVYLNMFRSLESVGLLQDMWGESVTLILSRSLLWVSFCIHIYFQDMWRKFVTIIVEFVTIIVCRSLLWVSFVGLFSYKYIFSGYVA